MNILLTGHISFVLMKQFYPMLREALPEANIAIYGLNKPGSSLSEEDRAIFGQLIDPPTVEDKAVKRQILTGTWLWRKAGRPKPWWQFGKQLLTGKLRAAYDTWHYWLAQEERDAAMAALFENYDIIHFNYCAPAFLGQLRYVQPRHQVLLSFWGSDLFQETGKETYAIQYDALQRADAVTLHSPEMEQIFLSKFGRSLQPKVHQLIFGCHRERFDTIDLLQQQVDKQQAFREKHHIPTNKTIVQIGYSGGPGHQHIAVIEALETQGAALKDRLFLLVPTTYNNQDSDYFNQLKTKLESSIFAYAHLVDYLTDEEVLLLPVIADVHINVRDADALNNAMTEAIYAGCQVMVGAWLPYGIYRRAGATYHEITDLTTIPRLLQHPEQGPSPAERAQNAIVARALLSMHHRIDGWATLYRNLYQRYERT